MAETTDYEEDITMEELDLVLKKAKNRKSPGTDNLNVELFKYGGRLLKNKLLQLLNNIRHNHQIPRDWETEIIIYIHKKSPKNNCKYYITLLSTASKLYANILKNKLNRHSESILEGEQCGFRRGRSTMDAIFTLQQILEKQREFNLPTFILFVKYEKAYDSLNQGKLSQILRDEDIPTQLLKAIHSLYQNSKISIKYNDGQISEPINTNKGVRQGCGLSSDLFNIYINKAIKEWKQTTQSEIQLGSGKMIQTILYVDDQVITAESEYELHIAVCELNKIVKEYGMKITTTKTKIIGLCGKTFKGSKQKLKAKS
jgi:hypothetical protein